MCEPALREIHAVARLIRAACTYSKVHWQVKVLSVHVVRVIAGSCVKVREASTQPSTQSQKQSSTEQGTYLETSLDASLDDAEFASAPLVSRRVQWDKLSSIDALVLSERVPFVQVAATFDAAATYRRHFIGRQRISGDKGVASQRPWMCRSQYSN